MQQQHLLVLFTLAAAAIIDPANAACNETVVPATCATGPYYSSCIPIATPYTCLEQSRYMHWTNVVQLNSENLLENIRRMNLTDYTNWDGLCDVLVKGTSVVKFLRRFARTNMYLPLPQVFQSNEMLQIVPTYWLAYMNTLVQSGFSVWDLASQACATNAYTPYTSGDIECGCLNMPGRNVTLRQCDPVDDKDHYGCMPDQCTCKGNNKKIGAAHIIFSSYSCMDSYCSNAANKCLRRSQCDTV